MTRRPGCTVNRRPLARFEGGSLLVGDPKGRFVAIGTSTGVSLIDREGTLLRTFELGGSAGGLDVSSDGARLVVDVLAPDPPLHHLALVELDSARVVALDPLPASSGWKVRPVFGPDGRLLVLGDPLELRTLDATTTLVRSWPLPRSARGPVFPSTAAFDSAGSRLAIASLDPETITVLDASTFETEFTLGPINHAPGQGTNHLVFVDGSSKLLTHTTHSTSLWDLATRTKITSGVYATAMKNTYALAVSTDGRTAAVTFTRGGLVVFDTLTGIELVDDWTALDTRSRILSAAFLPSEDTFLTLDAEGHLESFSLVPS